MSAGTVISGGFPGRVAREVFPNQKCEGCLHYDHQGGRTGVCTIGLRPDNCGDGEAPDVSYAPIARGAGSYLPDLSNHGAHAPEVDPQVVGGLYGSGSTRPVRIHQVSLGEEHVHLVKSMVERHADLQKSQCLRCSMRGAYGAAPYNTDPQLCSCRPLEAATVVKAIVERMSNAQRAKLVAAPGWMESAKEWVRGVAKAGFKLPAARDPRGAAGALADALARMGVKVEGRSDDRNGGHLQRARRADPEPEVVAKSIYSDDWIIQFKGTPLFDQARVLCERELALEEDELKRDEERRKHERSTRAVLDKLPKLESEDWRGRESRRAKIRIAKQRLVLKLAELHQQRMTAVSKAGEPESAPRVSNWKAPHGTYKVEHHADHAVVHYKPKADSPAPPQTARMKSGEHATKMARIHAFVNDHGFGENGHATLHADHVKIHDGDETKHVTSMGQAREHLGY